MATVKVAVQITAGPERVWDDVSDIASHVEWMTDAVAIRFTGAARRGVGTRFDCDTRVGPIRLTDHMEVTEWREGSAIGIEHTGLVTGRGRFTLSSAGDGGTRFTWEERLRFPWWMAGPIGAALAAPVLRLIWRRNLANLSRRLG